MLNTSEKTNFWDKRILAWEQRHYKTRFSSIAQRKELAGQYIKKHCCGKQVLELGCGSAMLAKTIIEAGAQSYTGIDLSPVAIKNAFRINSNTSNCSFIMGKLEDAQELEFDIIFSLGLMDWLHESEQRQLAQLSHNKIFLHSFTEKLPFTLFFNLLHKLYSKTYATPKKYEPIHQHRTEVQDLFPGPNRIVRSPRMFISSFATNL